MRRWAAGLLLCLAAAQVASVSAAGPTWQAVASVPGLFDVGGPRKDGWLVVAGAGRLYLVDPAGAVTPYAQGPGGYADDRGGEAYLAVSPGLHLDSPGCDFQPDDVFILRLHAPLGITRVDRQGNKSAFTTIPGVTGLDGIAFDTVGSFGHRLLATGSVGPGQSEVAAIDCNGVVSVITRSAPFVEGGIAVAPAGFGAFGGMLIAPAERSGNIYAFGADGTSTLVVKSGLPAGQDIGVEGVGFVPPGFSSGGAVFFSDRATKGSAHPGTDSLLRLSSSDLTTAGVQEGDLLAATEGGATAIAVRCAAACSVTPVVAAATSAHGEGHLVFTVPRSALQPSPTPTTSPRAAAGSAARPSSPSGAPAAQVAVILALLVVGAGALAVWRARSRR